MTSPLPLLDHIVILVPHPFLTSPPKWLTDLFTLFPGGQHADGLTENILVVFTDGVYLEFIAFVAGIDQKKRAAHRWGRKKEGTVIDWAVTLAQKDSNEDEDQQNVFRQIQRKVKNTKTGVEYVDLIPGGRRRPDGVELKWAVSSALVREQDGNTVAAGIEPGIVPFWCLDRSPRELRVPYENAEYHIHPSGTTGVAGIKINLPDGKPDFDSLAAVYDSLIRKEERNSGLRWVTSGFAGHGDGPSTQVQLKPHTEAAGERIEIIFFTQSKNLSGRKAGGTIADGKELQFEFVEGHEWIRINAA